MQNYVIIIGKLTKNPEVTTEEGKGIIIELAIPRSFKNKDGEYETDYVSCILMGAVAKSTAEYCHKGVIIGVKGYITTELIAENGQSKRVMNIVAERVTFLSSKKQNDNN